MAKALTNRSIEVAKPASQRREIPDGLLPGLYLIIQPSGARSWAVRYRHHGRPCKHTLGPYPAIDLAAARKLASAVLRAVAEGRDPGQEKRHARTDSVEAIARSSSSSTATGTIGNAQPRRPSGSSTCRD